MLDLSVKCLSIGVQSPAHNNHERTQTKEGNLVPNKHLVPAINGLREKVRDAVFEYYQPKPELDEAIQKLYGPVLETLFRFRVDVARAKLSNYIFPKYLRSA
jgi:hypothetical protein